MGGRGWETTHLKSGYGRGETKIRGRGSPLLLTEGQWALLLHLQVLNRHKGYGQCHSQPHSVSSPDMVLLGGLPVEPGEFCTCLSRNNSSRSFLKRSSRLRAMISSFCIFLAISFNQTESIHWIRLDWLVLTMSASS